MSDPILCRVCDRLFDPAFEICPFCGSARLPEETFAELLEEPFERLEEQARGTALERMDRLISKLDDMEHDLDAFLDTASSVPHAAR